MKRLFNETYSPKVSSILYSSIYWMLFLFLLVFAGTQSRSLLTQWHKFTYGMVGSGAAILAVWILLKIERKSFSEYGLVWEGGTLSGFFKGLLTGIGIFAGIILILVVFTGLQFAFNPEPWDPLSLLWYLAIIPLALMEEIAFRSYPFLKLNKAFGLRVTQVVVSILFALYHVIQGWDMQIAFLGPGAWAFVFGLAAIRSGGIAVPTGIHFSLNLMQELVGMKSSEYESIWVFVPDEGTSSETVGIIIQLLVLITAIVLTEIHIRRMSK